MAMAGSVPGSRHCQGSHRDLWGLDQMNHSYPGSKNGSWHHEDQAIAQL